MIFFGDRSKFKSSITEGMLSKYPDSIHLVDASIPWPEQADPKKTILLACGEDCGKALIMMQEKNIRHLIHVTRGDFEKELKLSVRALTHTQEFLSSAIEKILGQTKANPLLRIDFTSMNQKESTLIKFKEVIGEIETLSSRSDVLLNIIDELFTNALYNAPVDREGHHINQDKSRTEKVKIDGEHKAPHIFLFTDKDNAAVGCLDYYGSLESEALLSRLSELYRSDLAQARMGSGGAGLGYRMMLENSSALYVVVEKNKKTFVCFTMPLTESLRKAAEYPKNLHFIFY